MQHKYDDTTEPWVDELQHDVLWLEGPGSLRVMEVVVKIRHSGLMAVIKVRRGEERLVGFTGAKSLRSLSGKVRDKIKDPNTVWKFDEWA